MRYNMTVPTEAVAGLAIPNLAEECGFKSGYYLEAVTQLGDRLGVAPACVV